MITVYDLSDIFVAKKYRYRVFNAFCSLPHILDFFYQSSVKTFKLSDYNEKYFFVSRNKETVEL